MTISYLERIPVGNAVRVFVSPPTGATRWRLLRKTADTFAGQDDTSAAVIYDGHIETSVLDWWVGLLNGTPYFYKLYSYVASAWVASATASIVPQATDSDASVDVLSIVRERIDLGLQVELARGKLQHKDGRIPVLTAPPLYENTNWPVVTVHVNSDASGERGLGELVSNDVFNDDEEWESSEGWLSRWNVGIQGWSLNPDERIALRKAIKRIVIGNLSVFDDAGMVQIDLSQQDAEEFERYSAPVYQTVGTLTCLAPSLDSATASPILDVSVTGDYEKTP